MPRRDKEKEKQYQRTHYKKNKAAYLAKNRRNKARQRNRLRALVEAAKEGKDCLDCGGSFPPYVMDFDHRPGTVKKANVGDLVCKGCPDAVLLTEIKKCDLICSNCHRIRTHKRNQPVAQR